VHNPNYNVTEPQRLIAIAQLLHDCCLLTDDQGAIETLLQAARDLLDRAHIMEQQPAPPLKP
jgi:hypothetical protein